VEFDTTEDHMTDRLVKSKGIPFQELKPGVSRRILGYIDQLMLVEMRFKKGTIGEPHGHPHAQTGYVLKGSFEVQMGEKKEILREGDCYLVEPHVIHGVVCLEDDSRLLDVFTPKRDDFLKH